MAYVENKYALNDRRLDTTRWPQYQQEARIESKFIHQPVHFLLTTKEELCLGLGKWIQTMIGINIGYLQISANSLQGFRRGSKGGLSHFATGVGCGNHHGHAYDPPSQLVPHRSATKAFGDFT